MANRKVPWKADFHGESKVVKDVDSVVIKLLNAACTKLVNAAEKKLGMNFVWGRRKIGVVYYGVELIS